MQVVSASRYGTCLQVALLHSCTLPVLIISIRHTVSHLAFDTMTSVCFGAGFNTMRDPKYRYVMDAIEESNIRLGVLLQAQQLTRMHLDNRLFPSSVTARSQFARFIRSVLRDRLQASISGDIFSFLQQCKDPATGEALTMPELSTETATFIVAGQLPVHILV